MPNENRIEKDDLFNVAKKAETLSTMLADITQDFFGSTDYKRTISYDSERLRRYIELCFDLSHDLTAELHENGIWCYSKEVVA